MFLHIYFIKKIKEILIIVAFSIGISFLQLELLSMTPVLTYKTQIQAVSVTNPVITLKIGVF